MKRFAFLWMILASVLVSGCQPNRVSDEVVSVAGGSYRDISPEELNRMLKNKDFLFINVHIPYAGNIAGTDLSIPYDQIESNIGRLPGAKDAKIVIYCRSGHMGAIAAASLVKLGYTNVSNLKGGMLDWQRAGFGLEQ